MITLNDISTQTAILNIHQAAAIGDLNLVKYYIETGTNVDSLYNFSTPLYISLEHDNIDIAKYLISKGADLLVIDENDTYLYLSNIVKNNGYNTVDEYITDLEKSL